MVSERWIYLPLGPTEAYHIDVLEIEALKTTDPANYSSSMLRCTSANLTRCPSRVLQRMKSVA